MKLFSESSSKQKNPSALFVADTDLKASLVKSNNKLLIGLAIGFFIATVVFFIGGLIPIGPNNAWIALLVSLVLGVGIERIYAMLHS